MNRVEQKAEFEQEATEQTERCPSPFPPFAPVQDSIATGDVRDDVRESPGWVRGKPAAEFDTG